MLVFFQVSAAVQTGKKAQQAKMKSCLGILCIKPISKKSILWFHSKAAFSIRRTTGSVTLTTAASRLAVNKYSTARDMNK